MKKFSMFAVLLFVAGSTFAQSWTLDKAHSKLGFTVTHLGVSEVDGTFKKFDATMTATKEDLSDAAFTATAEVGSVDTGNEMRNGHLQGDGWFNAAQFPTITFKSTSFTKVDGKNYKIVGDLTLHGVTKSVTLNAVVNGPVPHPMNKKPLVGIKFLGSLNRNDFTVGKSGNLPVSEEIVITGAAEFTK